MSVVKYTFDVEFRPEGDLISNAARARQKKAYSHAEIDQMCARAREQGMKSSQIRAQEAVATSAEEAVTALKDVLARTAKDVEQVRAEAAQIALLAAKKLARAALAAMPEAEIEIALREAMHQAIGEPRIVLRTTQGVVDAITAELSKITHDEGFDGRVQIIGDPALKGTDCRVEWRGGGAERSEQAIEHALHEIIARHFVDRTDERTTEV